MSNYPANEAACPNLISQPIRIIARLPAATPDMAPEEFREAFDELTEDTGDTITGGPYSRQ